MYNRNPPIAHLLLDKGAQWTAKVQGKDAYDYAKMVVKAAPNDARKGILKRLEDIQKGEVEAQHHFTQMMSRAGGGGGAPSSVPLS